MIVQTVREGNFHLLDYQDASELSYSDKTTELSYLSEEIAECLKGYIKTSEEMEKTTDDDNYLKEQLGLLYALSYLYIPKEEFSQRMRDNYRLKEFEKCCVKSAKDGGDIKGVKKLPFLKETILESLMREWKIAENQKQKDILECAGLGLAYYQEGVGLEDLHMVGMDTEKMEELSKEEDGMLLAKKLNSDEVNEHRKKWEHFNKLCEKDTTIIQGFIVGNR